MTTLHPIILFLSGVSSAALTFLACYSFFALRRMGRRQRDIERSTSTTLMITMVEHVKNGIDELNDMKQHMNRLVEDEQYEAAEQLKGIIEKHEQNVKQSIDYFKRIFGDNVDLQMVKDEHPQNDNPNS